MFNWYVKYKMYMALIGGVVAAITGIGMIVYNACEYIKYEAVEVHQEDKGCNTNAQVYHTKKNIKCDIVMTYTFEDKEYTFEVQQREPSNGKTEKMYIDPYEPGVPVNISHNMEFSLFLIGIGVLCIVCAGLWSRRVSYD